MPRNTITDYRSESGCAPNKYEQAERRRSARSRAKPSIKSAEMIVVEVPKPRAFSSNMKNMIEDLQDIDKLRDARHTLHGLLNDDDWDLSDMDDTDIAHYRRSFEKVYGTLSEDIDIREIIAMATVRLDLLTNKIVSLLREFDETFGAKIVDDWER